MRAAPLENGAARAPTIPIVLIAVATLAVHLASSGPGASWMWGAHFYAFFPAQLLYGASLLVAAATVLLLLREESISSKITGVLSRGLDGRRIWGFAALSVAFGTCLFWVFRICHTYLGDGAVIVDEIDTSRTILHREPLTSLLQHAVYTVTKPWFFTPQNSIEAVARNAVAVGSVVTGGVFLALAWPLADELSRLRSSHESDDRRPVAFLLWLVLVTQGYVQLFFGYVENYSFQATGMVLFLWLSLRYLRGACALLWPALALSLCVALHFSSLLLGLPFLVLVAAGLRTPERKRAALRDLAISGLAITIVVVLAVRKYDPIHTLLDMFKTAFASRRNPGYMFSGAHYRDFFNEQLLIGPLGMFLFFGAAAYTAIFVRGARNRTIVFSLVAGLAMLVPCWMIGDSNLGYARDWDLLSHTGIVFTTAGLALLLVTRVPRPALVAALVIAVFVSLYHTVPWIATNASETRSLARLVTLPLGLGRTEVMVAWWYKSKGDETSERDWLHRSLAANRRNASAYYQLGVLDMKHRAYGDAIDSFQHMVALRPDKIEFRGRLAHAYYLADRLPEAASDLQFIVTQQPANRMALFYLGESLQQGGRTDEATEMFTRAEPLCLAAVIEQPEDGSAAATYGWVLFRLGRDDESLTTLTHAAGLESPAPVAHCYLGYVLNRMGREDDSRDRFATCLALDDEVPERRRIEMWLAGTGPPPSE